MTRKLFFAASVAFCFSACQNAETSPQEEEVTDPITGNEDVTLEQEHDAPEEYEKGGLRIYPKPKVARFENASLSMTSPEEGMVSEGNSVQFDFGVENYELGAQTQEARMGLANSDKGQHIHLIVDNDPYSAHYEPGFTKEFPTGHHYAIAFLSRSYHESVKNEDAYKVFQFVTGTGDQDDPRMMDLDQPMLFYSRPKGSYSGETAKEILFDFYLHNAELSADGYSVLTTINDSLEFEFDTWQPYIIEGLPAGENTIQIQLVDASGTPINSEVNSVTRTFTIEK